MENKKVLLVFDTSRSELFSYLEKDINNNYYILFNERKDKANTLPGFIKKEFFWDDYKTPFALLNIIKPDTLVFQEIFDLKQIALNIAARKKGIPTYFLDHGIWNNFESLKENDRQLETINRNSKLGKLRRFNKVFQGYLFYYSSIKGVQKKNLGKFLRLPVVAFFKSLLTALAQNKFIERRAEQFILFSRHNYQTVSQYYGCEEKEVTYTGFPFYDGLAKVQLPLPVGDYIVFIDHPHLEQNILNWDETFHKKVAMTISDISEISGKKIKIKLHPKSNINRWKHYDFLSDKTEIIQQPVDDNFYLNSNLIIGYASTMLIGFICAKKNVILVGWHPQPKIFGIDFSLFGVCHKSLYFSEVKSLFKYWHDHNLALQNKESYKKFVEYFNSPFDGVASKRVIEIISR